jgi:hypothetical protein
MGCIEPLLGQITPDYPYQQMRVRPLQPLRAIIHLLMVQTLVPVYDARALCKKEFDVEALESCRTDQKGGLERLRAIDVGAGSFVGIVHCAKWITSAKRAGKERVQLSIAEVYLLADAEVGAE